MQLLFFFVSFHLSKLIFIAEDDSDNFCLLKESEKHTRRLRWWDLLLLPAPQMKIAKQKKRRRLSSSCLHYKWLETFPSHAAIFTRCCCCCALQFNFNPWRDMKNKHSAGCRLHCTLLKEKFFFFQRLCQMKWSECPFQDETKAAVVASIWMRLWIISHWDSSIICRFYISRFQCNLKGLRYLHF